MLMKAWTIVMDQSLMRPKPTLMELEALATKAVALLACHEECISATIFRKPKCISYWISLMDNKHKMLGLYELRPQAPVVDFEIVNKAASDLVG